MTWHADEIITAATPQAIAAIKSSLLVSAAYVVQSLDDHLWYREDIKHALPPHGLLVVQPICEVSEDGDYWYQHPPINWNQLAPMEAPVSLDSGVAAALAEYTGSDAVPPLAFRQFLAESANRLGQPIVFYSCAMWGGDIDHEYALIYTPDERLVMTEPTLPPERPGGEDALRIALAKLGLTLPTGYFALHTREFPWSRHRVTNEA